MSAPSIYDVLLTLEAAGHLNAQWVCLRTQGLHCCDIALFDVVLSHLFACLLHSDLVYYSHSIRECSGVA